MSIFDTPDGKKALAKVGFSLDEHGHYTLVADWGPLGSALAIVAMMEWLAERLGGRFTLEQCQGGWLVRGVPRGEYMLQAIAEGPTKEEALIVAVNASEDAK